MPSSVASLPMVNPSNPSTEAMETAVRKIESRVFRPRVRLTLVLGGRIFITEIIARPFVLLARRILSNNELSTGVLREFDPRGCGSSSREPPWPDSARSGLLVIRCTQLDVCD